MDDAFEEEFFEDDDGDDASQDGFEQAVEQAQAEHHAAAPAVAALRNPAQLTRDPSIGAGAHAHLPNAATGKFASRRQAKALLLRRTEFSSGAKFFAGGAVTVRVTQAVFRGTHGLAPRVALQIVLLGREVTRPKELDVELPAAGEALPAGGLEVELDVAVAYEESPEAFAALLRKAPLAEVRLLRAAPQKGEPALLARAAVDLATLDADLVDATVPLCAATPAGRTAAAGPAPSTVTLSITAPPPDSTAATPRKPEPTTPPHSPPAAPPSRSPRKSPSKSPPNQIAMLEEARRLARANACLLYTSPSPRDKRQSRMPSSA